MEESKPKTAPAVDISELAFPVDSEQVEGTLTPEQEAQVVKEAELEQKYGDSPIKAAALGSARGLTLGLSDQALKKSKLFSSEELREIEERNKLASTIGEFGSIIASAPLTGGTSTAARGAQVLGVGVTGAAKVARATEALSAKALDALLKKSGNKKIASEIIRKSVPKAAGFGTEGLLYGTGELISENALGRAELNAENLAASAGSSALFGAGVGSAFGATSALVPSIKNGKVVDYISKKIKSSIDPKQAGVELAGFNPSEALKLKDLRPDIYDNIPNFFKTRLKLEAFDSSKKLLEKSTKSIDDIGSEIDNLITQLDSKAVPELYPTRQAIAMQYVQDLQGFKETLKQGDNILPTGVAKKFAEQVDEQITESLKFAKLDDIYAARNKVADLESKLLSETKVNRKKAIQAELSSAQKKLDDLTAISNTRLNAADLQQMKSRLQKLSKYTRNFQDSPLADKLNKIVAARTKSILVDTANAIDPALASSLEKTFLDYGTAIRLTDSLASKTSKESARSFAGLRDIVLADVAMDLGGVSAASIGIAAKKIAESDLLRKIKILSSVQKANESMQLKISEGIKDFFTGAKKIARPTSVKVLSKFYLSKKDGKEAKDKQQAIKNISENLGRYQDSTVLLNDVSRATLPLYQVAPETAQAMASTALKTVQFLSQKVPKIDSSNSIRDKLRGYTPSISSFDIAKFERYVEAIEDPLSVIDDIRSNTLTREKVDAIKAVYPELYKTIQEKTLDYVSNSESKISYNKRIQLGILLDIPTDISLEPLSIRGLQQTYIQQQPQQANSAVNPTVGGMEQLNVAGRTATEITKIETNEDI